MVLKGKITVDLREQTIRLMLLPLTYESETSITEGERRRKKKSKSERMGLGLSQRLSLLPDRNELPIPLIDDGIYRTCCTIPVFLRHEPLPSNKSRD